MNPKISDLLARIQQMELEIEQEMKRKRAELQADFEETRVRFEREVLEQQRRFKTGVIAYCQFTERANGPCDLRPVFPHPAARPVHHDLSAHLFSGLRYSTRQAQ
jgi:hypothetical protein